MGTPVRVPLHVLEQGWGVTRGDGYAGTAGASWWPDVQPEEETDEQRREAEAIARLRRMGVRL